MKSRILKLQEGLTQPGEAALVLSDVNRFYLSGFASSAGAVFITRKAAYLLVDFRYGEAAQKQVKDLDVVVFDSLSQQLCTLAKRHRVKKVYLEGATVSVKQANVFKKSFRAIDVKTACDDTLDLLLSNMRMIKGRAEILKIKEAQRITEEAYLDILNFIRPGVTERDIALELEFSMRKRGAQRVAFDLITIAGKKTSLPHGVPGTSAVCAGDFVTMDIGAVYEGYHSDMTRTVAVSYVTDKQAEIYNLVLQTQQSALAKIKSGVTGHCIDRAARDVIEQAGYGQCYKHATGHGVGLLIHEEPRLSQNSPTILSSGMVVTVEPGIYLPGEFGVRIEDMVAVTKNGCTNLTGVSKELLIL